MLLVAICLSFVTVSRPYMYVACRNFTLTWPLQCQALCFQRWLFLITLYLWYLKLSWLWILFHDFCLCCCCFEGICASLGPFWWDSVQSAQGEMEACLPLQVWYKDNVNGKGDWKSLNTSLSLGQFSLSQKPMSRSELSTYSNQFLVRIWNIS